MKWKKKELGKIIVMKAFLFFPKTINGETRWLEWAEWEEEFWSSSPTFGSGYEPTRWLN